MPDTLRESLITISHNLGDHFTQFQSNILLFPSKKEGLGNVKELLGEDLYGGISLLDVGVTDASGDRSHVLRSASHAIFKMSLLKLCTVDFDAFTKNPCETVDFDPNINMDLRALLGATVASYACVMNKVLNLALSDCRNQEAVTIAFLTGDESAVSYRMLRRYFTVIGAVPNSGMFIREELGFDDCKRKSDALCNTIGGTIDIAKVKNIVDKCDVEQDDGFIDGEPRVAEMHREWFNGLFAAYDAIDHHCTAISQPDCSLKKFREKGLESYVYCLSLEDFTDEAAIVDREVEEDYEDNIASCVAGTLIEAMLDLTGAVCSNHERNKAKNLIQSINSLCDEATTGLSCLCEMSEKRSMRGLLEHCQNLISECHSMRGHYFERNNCGEPSLQKATTFVLDQAHSKPINSVCERQILL